MDRLLKVNTRPGRAHSLYHQGKYYYDALLTMKPDSASALLARFDRLLRDPPNAANSSRYYDSTSLFPTRKMRGSISFGLDSQKLDVMRSLFISREDENCAHVGVEESIHKVTMHQLLVALLGRDLAMRKPTDGSRCAGTLNMRFVVRMRWALKLKLPPR